MFRKLSDIFSERKSLPVEVEEIASELTKLGKQDEIIFSPADTDPGKIKGIFYQYTQRKKVYGDTHLVTLIIYSKNVSLPWQRVICAKEIVHVCDGELEKVDDEEKVAALLEKILGPLATEDFGLADFLASIDKMALYQCLDILFPLSAREVAAAAVKNGNKTISEIADWAQIPEEFVSLVLSDGWPSIREKLIDL